VITRRTLIQLAAGALFVPEVERVRAYSFVKLEPTCVLGADARLVRIHDVAALTEFTHESLEKWQRWSGRWQFCFEVGYEPPPELTVVKLFSVPVHPYMGAIQFGPGEYDMDTAGRVIRRHVAEYEARGRWA